MAVYKGQKIKQNKGDYWKSDEGIKKIAKWAKQGCTNKDICHNGGFSVNRLWVWRHECPKLDKALKRSQKQVDEIVKSKLFERATGTTVTDTTYKMVKVDDEILRMRRAKYKNEYKLDHPDAPLLEVASAVLENVPVYEQIPIIKNEKEIVPDTTAMIFWLKNRDPNNWRDRHETEITGSLDTNTHVLDNLDKKEVAKIAREKLKKIRQNK